jgi:hypothetical protein
MKPEKALELVGKYSRLTHAIGACKKRIGDELDKCPGLKGFRLEVIWTESFDEELIQVPSGRAQGDQVTHLAGWYAKDYGEPGEFGYEPFTVGEGDEETDCPHCFAAHLIVQERKALRKQLATVKGAMTRGGAV